MSWAQASERARWAEMALMLVVFTVAAGERAVKIKLPAGAAFNCRTQGRAGSCAKVDRKDATRDLIDFLDIGMVNNYLPDVKAHEILKALKEIPDAEWVKVDNKEERAYMKNGGKAKASVDMDYHYYDLHHDNHQHIRGLLEPLFTELFLGPGQVLSLFCGKYSQGSYVTSHTDDQVVTLDGQDRYRRKRAFLLYLNEEWTTTDGGLFSDEEDKGKPGYTPAWNTLLHFRVPRWHLVTPVEAAKTRWSVYGWSLEPIPPMHVRIFRTIVANPQPFLVVLALVILIYLRSGIETGELQKKE